MIPLLLLLILLFINRPSSDLNSFIPTSFCSITLFCIVLSVEFLISKPDPLFFETLFSLNLIDPEFSTSTPSTELF